MHPIRRTQNVEIDALFTAIEVRIIKTPVRAPRANLIPERFVGRIRSEVLDRILIFNQAARGCRTTTEIRDVRRSDRLGGLIHEYQQLA